VIAFVLGVAAVAIAASVAGFVLGIAAQSGGWHSFRVAVGPVLFLSFERLPDLVVVSRAPASVACRHWQAGEIATPLIVNGQSARFMLDALPGMSPWVTWPIGIILSIGVLYQGIPRMMEPDPPHAFGLYLMSAFLLIFITGLARFVTAWYLQGKFAKLDSVISGLAARLPF